MSKNAGATQVGSCVENGVGGGWLSRERTLARRIRGARRILSLSDDEQL